MHWHVGPLGDYNGGIPNQAVFISGFKIAIRDGMLGRRWVEVAVDAPSTHSQAGSLYKDGGKGQSRVGKLWRKIVSGDGGNSGVGEHAEADSAYDAVARVPDGFMEVGGDVLATHIPGILQVRARAQTDIYLYADKYARAFIHLMSLTDICSARCVTHTPATCGWTTSDGRHFVQDPEAVIAVTHDSQWSSLIEKVCCYCYATTLNL